MLEKLPELLGFLTGFAILFLILNYCVKWTYRNYISKMAKSHKELVGLYQKVMKIIVKYHKPIGALAIVLALLHLWLMVTYFRVSWFGVTALIILIITALIGIILYKLKGKFLLFTHRGATIVLIIALGLHALFK